MDVNGNDNTPYWGYCQKEGCSNAAIACYMSGNYPPDEPDDLLCADHCGDEGYCWGCGHFWAGCEGFDFNQRGLCPNCHDDPDLGYESEDDEIDWSFDPFEEDLHKH